MYFKILLDETDCIRVCETLQDKANACTAKANRVGAERHADTRRRFLEQWEEQSRKK